MSLHTFSDTTTERYITSNGYMNKLHQSNVLPKIMVQRLHHNLRHAMMFIRIGLK